MYVEFIRAVYRQIFLCSVMISRLVEAQVLFPVSVLRSRSSVRGQDSKLQAHTGVRQESTELQDTAESAGSRLRWTHVRG